MRHSARAPRPVSPPLPAGPRRPEMTAAGAPSRGAGWLGPTKSECTKYS